MNATTTQLPSKQIASKAELAGLGVHTITLPSGARVRIRIPDQAMLIRANAVPQRLRAVALARVMDEMEGTNNAALTEETVAAANGNAPAGMTEEQMEAAQQKVNDTVDYHVYLVSEMLAEPAFSFEELAATPCPVDAQDMVMLIGLALRERTQDAAGVRLGVARLDDFRATFRSKHGCGEDCAKCDEAIQEHSTVDLGLLRMRGV